MKKLKKFWGTLCFGLIFPLIGFAGGSDTESESEASEPWTLNMPEVVEDEEGNPVGIVLHLPEDLVEACKDKYWNLDEGTEEKIKACMSTQEGCRRWCSENRSGTEYQHEKRCEFAFALLLVNEKGYVLSGPFCKGSGLDKVLACIGMRGRTRFLCSRRTMTEQYVKNMHWLIEDF